MDVRDRLEQLLAISFSKNRMPDMSGDHRKRLTPLQKRDMDEVINIILSEFDIKEK